MRALEDLLGSVNDPASREHLREATRAYEAAAFKAAIVSLWVAVAVDLVAKVRAIADQGEASAVKHIQELDAAIAGRDKQKLMAIERELLDKCRDDYEFIDARDHDTLTRLQEDRHICAHPAFVSPDVVFEPSAELVRAHFATAVDAVLRHGPTPGRKAIDRFTSEISGSAWPTKTEDLRDYLRERYFARGKDVLRRNLAQVIVKGSLDPPGADFRVWKRLRKSALVLDDIAPASLAEALDAVVGRVEKDTGLSDLRIVRFIGALGELSTAWDSVPETSVPRFVTLVESFDFEQLASWAVLSATTPVDAVEKAIDKRLQAASDDELQAVIAVRRAKKHLPLAMERFTGSRGWRPAERRMELMVLPLARFMTVDDLRLLRSTLQTNEQVREASSMPPLLEQLYDVTSDVSGAQAEWEDIVSDLAGKAPDGDPEHYYAYPQLRARVRA